MTTISWHQLLSGPNSATILRAAMTSVAHGLSRMLGEPISCGAPELRRLPAAHALTPPPARQGEVGVHLEIESGLRGGALVRCSQDLVERLVQATPGAISGMDPLQRAALAEVGNLMLAYFLNAVVELTDASELVMPSTPRVVADMLPALLNVVLTPLVAGGDEALIIETSFTNQPRTTDICLWVLPNLAEEGQVPRG